MNGPDKNPIDEREWQAQEDGMRAARGRNAEATTGDEADAYRMVAGALLSHPHDEPPRDFAAAVVAHVTQREARLERALSRFLVAAFVVGIVATAALYGDDCWQAMQRLPGDDAFAWTLAAVACVAVSWMARQLAHVSAGNHHLPASRG